jgi:hypothetical protein
MAFQNPEIRREMIRSIQEPNLKQALRLLEPLFRHYTPDMHGANIMVRGTQWVFIDPVSLDDEDEV